MNGNEHNVNIINFDVNIFKKLIIINNNFHIRIAIV